MSIIAVVIALLSAQWAGKILFSNPRYVAGSFPISYSMGLAIYGLLITYAFFIPVVLVGFLKNKYRFLWMLVMLIPLLIFELAFGSEFILYSTISAIIGSVFGFVGQKFFLKNKQSL